MQKLDFLISEPAKPKGCLMWMHGLGASKHDFEFLIDLLPDWIVLLPEAKMSKVAINAGAIMPSWHNITSLNGDIECDFEDIIDSKNDLTELFTSYYLPTGLNAIGGFSQGAAMALSLGLDYQQKLTGLIAFSGYLPFYEKIKPNPINFNMPIYLAHGRMDGVVDFNNSLLIKKNLEKHYQVILKEYQSAHQVLDSQIADLKNWFDGLAIKNL